MTLAYLAAGVIAGAALSLGWGSDAIPLWRPEGAVLALWAVAAAAVVLAVRPRVLVLLPALVLLAFLTGLWRGGVDRSPQSPPPGVEQGARITLEGALLTDPGPFGDLVRIPLTVDESGATASGSFTLDVLAERITETGRFDRSPFEFRYGDRYEVTGTYEPDATVDRIGFLRRPEIVLLSEDAGNAARRWLARTRARLATSVHAAMAEPTAGVVVAETVGDRTGMSPEMRTRFRQSGAAHLLAISGMHVGIVGVAAFAFAERLMGRRRRTYLLVPLAALWGYALLAGMSEPVTRAAVMASVYLAARTAGRQQTVLPALGLAAAAMVLFDPTSISRAGFQLSFAAVAGIALLGPPLMRVADGLIERVTTPGSALRGVARGAAATFVVGTAATLATVPLVAFHFGQVPVWGVATTIAALPALPIVVVFGALTGAVGTFAPQVADILAWPAWIAGRYMIETVGFFARIPPGPFDAGGWSAGMAWLWYGVIVLVLGRSELLRFMSRAAAWVRDARRTRAALVPRGLRPAPRGLILLALAVAVLPIVAIASRPGPRLSVTFFETDRGDMILIKTPGGRQVLVDGGLDPDGAVRALGEWLPFWDRSLDLVVLTHPHADHAGGLLKVLERYEVDRVLDVSVDYDTATYSAWDKAAGRLGDMRLDAAVGPWIALDRDAALEVVRAGPLPGSTDANDSSVVLRLRFGDVSFLLTGDITATAERAILDSGADVSSTVLKVAHQGSRGSSSAEFLEAVSPALSVLQVGGSNPFGHPHEDTLERLAAAAPGAPLVVTAQRGDVTVSSDGQRVWLRTER